MESGCPALLGFELETSVLSAGYPGRHIIPVIGHTLNEDAWVPDAQRIYFGHDKGYFPSENWLSSYVIHDDNCGPYYCLPRNYLKKENLRLLLGLCRCKSQVTAVEAEAIAFSIASSIASGIPSTGQHWYDRFAVFGRCGLLVLRTLLVRKAEYLGHLHLVSDWEGNHLEPEIQLQINQLLPDWLWLTELSAPELFSGSRRKFGDIILSTDSSDLLMARLPGLLILKSGKGYPIVRTKLQGHSSLFLFPAP